MSFRHTLGTLFTMRPFDVSYANNLSSVNPCKFKKKRSHFHRYEKRKSIWKTTFSSFYYYCSSSSLPTVPLGEFLQIPTNKVSVFCLKLIYFVISILTLLD